MIIQLPYPHKALWPNGRAHWGTKASETKKHRAWAVMATNAARRGFTPVFTDGPIPVRLIVSCKSRGVEPDRDNCLAAAKAYFDGIAQELGINDSRFVHHPVHFSGRNSSFTIEVGL